MSHPTIANQKGECAMKKMKKGGKVGYHPKGDLYSHKKEIGKRGGKGKI